MTTKEAKEWQGQQTAWKKYVDRLPTHRASGGNATDVEPKSTPAPKATHTPQQVRTTSTGGNPPPSRPNSGNGGGSGGGDEPFFSRKEKKVFMYLAIWAIAMTLLFLGSYKLRLLSAEVRQAEAAMPERPAIVQPAETPKSTPASAPAPQVTPQVVATPAVPASVPCNERRDIQVNNGEQVNFPPCGRMILQGPMEATIVNSAEKIAAYSGGFKLCEEDTNNCAWTSAFSTEPSPVSVGNFLDHVKPWPEKTRVRITVKTWADLPTKLN